MAKFFVGQRVRIKYSLGWPELAGEEGRVIGTGKVTDGPGGGKDCWVVAPDCWGGCFAPRLGAHGAWGFGAFDDQLEPILPDGHRAGDYSLCELLDRCRQGITEAA